MRLTDLVRLVSIALFTRLFIGWVCGKISDMNNKPAADVRLWDLPTRLFHWLLAFCVIGAIVTVKVGGDWMDWHPRLGIAALMLVGFRIIWGLVGSVPSRFGTFLKGPATVWRYLKNPASVRYLGHNPLGGWSVMTMLLSIGIQAFTGLFITDDILFEGPLYSQVSSATASLMSTVHKTNDKVLMALLLLHLLAIALYTVKGKKLLGPMLRGDASSDRLPPATDPAHDDTPLRIRALILAIAFAAGGIWLASLSQ